MGVYVISGSVFRTWVCVFLSGCLAFFLACIFSFMGYHGAHRSFFGGFSAWVFLHWLRGILRFVGGIFTLIFFLKSTARKFGMGYGMGAIYRVIPGGFTDGVYWRDLFVCFAFGARRDRILLGLYWDLLGFTGMGYLPATCYYTAIAIYCGYYCYIAIYCTVIYCDTSSYNSGSTSTLGQCR